MRGTGTRRRGQALIEFALVMPLLFLLILNLVNFGAFIHAMITVTNAARTGAQSMIMRGAWAGRPLIWTDTQLIDLVKSDASSLPNKATGALVVAVCRNNAEEFEGIPSGCTTGGLSDPEAGLYVLGTVDVTYKYLPLIPFFDIPGLGIHLTLPPTTIHRRAVMRLVQ
jgi:hypothetical protein